MPVPKILFVALALIAIVGGYHFIAYEKTANDAERAYQLQQAAASKTHMEERERANSTTTFPK